MLLLSVILFLLPATGVFVSPITALSGAGVLWFLGVCRQHVPRRACDDPLYLGPGCSR
ncbi:MAG: hypothetical protein J07HX64_01202 [halophilic archaeon J07HX64]|nr:MAG: hypothetical protein J07HX64_01202 [halophilic archaeon J07HX64]